MACPVSLPWEYRVRDILVPERRRGYKQWDNLFSPPQGPYRRWGLWPFTSLVVSGPLHVSLVNRGSSVSEILPRHFFLCKNFDSRANPAYCMNTYKLLRRRVARSRKPSQPSLPGSYEEALGLLSHFHWAIWVLTGEQPCYTVYVKD